MGAWSGGGGGGFGRQDTMGQETVRGRAGMPSTARSESFEAVDVARRCAAAITKRASAASSAKASMVAPG